MTAPLPDAPPFLTLYTPTYRRPQALARCLESVRTQTAVARVDQLVLPDHCGYGVGPGLYGRMPWYVSAVRGDYVLVLADDDELADHTVVEDLEQFARDHAYPDVIVCDAIKNGLRMPRCAPLGEPVQGHTDLCCYVEKRDVWLRHIPDYGQSYEGDFHHAHAVWAAGHSRAYLRRLIVVGAAMHGRPEAA